MSKIKNPHKPNQGKNIKAPEIVEMQNFEHPVFCFRYLHKDYCLQQCDADDKRFLMERLVALSSLTWQEISQAQRHGFGYEKMPISKLAGKPHRFITEDVEHLLVFRYHANKPFLGHRNRFIFHLIFIERDFTLYDHGTK